jgi:3'(2'), 5'-bisphosphate nucleotidase
MFDEKLPELIAVAVKAGKAITDIYDSDDPGITFKEDSSPLTRADRAAHNSITRGLQSLSDYPILSEEGRSIPYGQRKTWETFWLVDPLDGTKEFIKKNGEFTVNIALVQNGIPVLGIVYSPVLKKLYFGSKTYQSILLEQIHDDTPSGIETELPKAMQLPITSNRERFTVVASRSHSNPQTEQYLQSLKKKHGDIHLTSMGSSLKLCLVADGTADIYPRLGPTMEWDTAAAHAVVLYAGGSVKEFESGRPLTYNKKELLNPYFMVER